MDKVQILNSMFAELRTRGVIKTQKDLASLIGGNEVTISNAMKGKYISDKLLSRINEAAGNIFSPVWVRTGVGQMLASAAEEQTFNVGMGSHSQIGGTGNTYNASADAEELQRLRIDNDDLRATVEDLKGEIAEKDKTIARLEGKIETYKEMMHK